MQENMSGNIQGGDKKGNGVLVGTIVAVLVAVSAYGFYNYTQKDETKSEPVVTTPTPQTPTPNPVVTSIYKDGTYTAVGNYVSPGGAETISVSITLKDDVVTSATVTPQATRPESKVKQADFAFNYKTFVIGKSIDEISLTKVSGSSLSPKGFMEALAEIKVQAKA